MGEQNQTGIIPENYTGTIIDTESSIEFETPEEAKAFFRIVRRRLLNVNMWHDLTGRATAEFQVVDKDGREVGRGVQQGDYFKIDVPGPGPFAGEGYDWVRVEAIREVSEAGMESVGIRVRPSTNPQEPDTDAHPDVVHFYSEESTSNFIVTREGSRITAGIYDRNTKSNKEGDLIDKARHWLMGLGAVKGFSRFQWQRLADGLLGK